MLTRRVITGHGNSDGVSTLDLGSTPTGNQERNVPARDVANGTSGRDGLNLTFDRCLT